MFDGARMLENILSGKTAMGEPFLPHCADQSITFTDTHQIRYATIAALELSARMFPPLEGKWDEDFTAYARKLVFHARQGGTLARNPSFLTRAGHAARIAREKRHILFTGIGFAALVTMAMQDEAAKRRLARTELTLDDQVAEMRSKAMPPPPHLCWEDEHRHYGLHEFTHPFHVWEEGVRLHNCLPNIHPQNWTTRVDSAADAALLWELEYWKGIENRMLSLFSLRSGTARIALIGMQESAMRELWVQFPNEPSLWAILADVSEYMEARYGDFQICIARPLAVEQAVIGNMRLERMKRHKRTPGSGGPLPGHGQRRRARRKNLFAGQV